MVAILFVGSLAPLRAAASDKIGKEVWLGGGVSWPVYHDIAIACGRAGIGAVFFQHVTLGASVQVDRDHQHFFGDAGLILPTFWDDIQTYGRFQFGRREDSSDDAYGWTGGLRFGYSEGAISIFVEAHGIIEPEEDNGVSVGFSF